MSWKDDLRVGLCPGRLIIARYRRGLTRRLIERSIVRVTDDPVRSLGDLVGRSRATVVLSNHYTRYGVLRWSANLRTTDEWLAYAKHHFSSTHGALASGWRIRVSAARKKTPRIACAIDAALLDRLRELRCVSSIQPYFVSAFNARRRSISGLATAWFVVQERDRMTLGLVGRSGWEVVRNRQCSPDWDQSLADLLDRETAACEKDTPDQVFICCENVGRAIKQIGRYRIIDLSIRRGESADLRPVVMALD